MQYYVSGRYAVAAQLVPVAGNHFHHAIEMFLKGAMADVADETARKNWRHYLVRAWAAFTERYAPVDLTRFDAVVADLDRFEDIRYPEPIVKSGLSLTWHFGRKQPAPVIRGPASIKVPELQLAVGDIDDLVREIFITASISPKFFPRNAEEEKYLMHQNAEVAFW